MPGRGGGAPNKHQEPQQGTEGGPWIRNNDGGERDDPPAAD